MHSPVSTSSPTNIFAIPDATIVIGAEIFWLPVMLTSNCIKIKNKRKKTNEKKNINNISTSKCVNSVTRF